MSSAALRAEIGAPPPEALVAALDDEQLGALTDAVRAAKAHQREALEDAGDAALGHLPMLLRKAVERVLR